MIGRPISMVAKYVCTKDVDATDYLEHVRAVSGGISRRKLESAKLSTMSKIAGKISAGSLAVSVLSQY